MGAKGCQRSVKGYQVLCAEISNKATKPGFDIFQSGPLIGTYDFPSQKICLSELTKIIRAHAWENGIWSRGVFGLLNRIKQLESMKFGEFSNAENEQLKNEASRIILRVVDKPS